MFIGVIALACLTMVPGDLGPEGARPNLKPVPWPGGWYGDLGPNGLRVKVKNVSRTTTAPESHTKVWFTASGEPNVVRVKVIPSLAPGAVKVISVPIPPAYWDPDLSYFILVDCRHEVLESNEDDNDASGTIPG
jgi:subtilase family serine protease